MKKRFLSVALLGLLSVGCFSFAACDHPEDDSITGSEDSTYSVTITNKEELQKSWPLGEPNRSLSIDLEPVANPASEIAAGNLAVTSSDPDVVAATGLSLTALGTGSATITATWNGASDSVDVLVVANTYDYSIAEVNALLQAETLKDGDTVSFYGQLSASFEANTTHMYSGIFLGDGDNALMLYAGSISSIFFDTNGDLIIPYGSNVGVVATVSAYNGFYEFKPSYVEILGDSYGITTPTVTEFTEEAYNALTYTDVGRLAKMELTYVSGTVSTEASTHSTIKCKVGNTNVNYYVNYHIGTDGVAAVAQKINSLSEGETFTSYGYIGWYNGPELCPAFLYVDGEVLTPDDCVIIADKAAPTTITISAEGNVTSLAANKTLQLTASVTPDDADQRMTWSSSDETIAKVSSTGLVSGVAANSTPVTITAASVIDSSVNGTISLTVTEPEYDTAPFTMGEAYFLGYQKNDGTYRYYNGKVQQTYYGDVSESMSDAARVTINQSGSFYTLQLDNGKYLGAAFGDHNNFKWDLDTAFEWEYNATYKTFVAYNDSGVGYCLGTNTTYDEIQMLALSNAASGYPATLYEIPDDLGEGGEGGGTGETVDPFIQVDTPVSGESYYIGFPDSGYWYMFNGTTDSYGDYLQCTTQTSEAVQIKVTDNNNGTWGLTFELNGTDYTIYAWPGSSSSGTAYGEITFIATSNLSSAQTNAVTAFTWNSSYSTFQVTLTNGTWYFSTYANKSSISMSSSTTYGFSHLYTANPDYEAPEYTGPDENTTFEQVTSLVDGEQYYLGSYSNGESHFITGQISNYQLATTTDVTQAVAVTATGDDSNGWKLTLPNGSYIYMYLYSGTLEFGTSSNTTVPNSGVNVFSWSSNSATLYTSEIKRTYNGTTYNYSYFEYYNNLVQGYGGNNLSSLNNAAHFYQAVAD